MTLLSALDLRVRALAPGLLLAFTIAFAASFLSEHYGGPVMLFALLLGMAFNFLSDHPGTAPGVGFASKTVLRIGVALLGIRLTLADLSALGWQTVLAVAGLIALTILSGFAGARIFGRQWRFALLTGGAVAICGASAALALAAVIPKNDELERNTLFTVVGVTTLSTIAMVVYPVVFRLLGLTDDEAGFLIGATIHDVAQVVGAGYSISDRAGETATVVKLLRVAFLPVVVLAVAFSVARSASRSGPLVPVFLIGFAALVGLRSTGLVPEQAVAVLSEASRWALVTAIAALGVKTNLGAVLQVGGGHVGVILLETLVLLGAALALVYSGLLS